MAFRSHRIVIRRLSMLRAQAVPSEFAAFLFSRQMKKFFKTVTFSLVVFCLFLLILEVILRTTHLFNARISWSEPDETYGWRFAPKAEYWNRPVEGGRSSGIINSYGWRDVEWSLNKKPGVYRVAVVGDSYVEAFQVELSETFLKIAEGLYRIRDIRSN
jgi:hypothetical protein